jgi:hypothetical protein
MNDKLEKMWKDAVVARFKVLLCISLTVVRKTTKDLNHCSRPPGEVAVFPPTQEGRSSREAEHTEVDAVSLIHNSEQYCDGVTMVLGSTHKEMVRSYMSKPALIFFSLQEYTQQNPLSKF